MRLLNCHLNPLKHYANPYLSDIFVFYLIFNIFYAITVKLLRYTNNVIIYYIYKTIYNIL